MLRRTPSTPRASRRPRRGPRPTPLGFAGEYTDAETGFQDLRARYYDPATGQFINRDALVEITGQPYTHALNNPPIYVDPSGLISIGGVLKTAVGAVKSVTHVVEMGASAVAAGAAVISGGQAVAGGALIVAEGAGTINTAATCPEYLALGGSLGDCVRSIVIDTAAAEIGRSSYRAS